MSALQLIMRKYAEKPPSTKEFKHDIFAIEPLARSVMENLSFQDALDLIRSKKEYITNPIAASGKLHFIWQLLLEHHWDDFIRTNSLFLLKREYKWNDVMVEVVYVKLQMLWKDWRDTNEQDQFPWYFLPERTPLGEEEYISIYALLRVIHFHDDQITFTTPRLKIKVSIQRPSGDEKQWRYSKLITEENPLMNPNVPIVPPEISSSYATTKQERLLFASNLYDYIKESCTIQMQFPFPLRTIDFSESDLGVVVGSVLGFGWQVVQSTSIWDLLIVTLVVEMLRRGANRVLSSRTALRLTKPSQIVKHMKQLANDENYLIRYTHALKIRTSGPDLFVEIHKHKHDC